MFFSALQATAILTPASFLFVIFFILGIVAQAHQAPLIPPLLICLIMCCFLYKLCPEKPFALRLLLICTAFSCGGIRYCMLENSLAQKMQQLCNKKTSIFGTILHIRTKSKGVSTLFVALENYPVSGTVQVDCVRPLACTIGDKILLHDLYFSVPEASSYGNYLKKEGILGTARTRLEQKFTVFAQRPTVANYFAQKRQELTARVATKLSERAYSFVGPLFFGHQLPASKYSDAVREQFQWWGISHYLARSGLHFVILLFIIQLLITVLPVSLFIKQLITMFFMGVYIIFSFASISFARAAFMILTYFGCSFARVQHHGLHTISLIGCFFLLYNPYQAFALDFQLSFALTSALILLKS